jgi:hypothetical protein
VAGACEQAALAGQLVPKNGRTILPLPFPDTKNVERGHQGTTFHAVSFTPGQRKNVV